MITRTLAALVALSACSTPPAPDDAAARPDTSVDVGLSVIDDAAMIDAPHDAVVIDALDAADPPAIERAACTTLIGLGFCGMSGEPSTCLDSLASFRSDADSAGCRSEYDAWVACLAALTSCPDASVLCPSEHAAFAMCVSPPP